MERYAQVLRQLQLIQHAIQHTYDAAHDECVTLEAQMPSEFYLNALNNLVKHRDELERQLDGIRQMEIVEDEVLQMVMLSLRADRLKEWLATH